MRHIIEADVAPSSAPDGIGQHYIDKTNKNAYISVGVSGVGDWVLAGASATADYKADGSVTMTGTHNADSNIVDNLVLRRYGESLQTPTISAGSVTLNLANGNIFSLVLTEDVTTMTVSNVLGSGMNCSFALYLKQDGTGGRSVTFPAEMDWGLQGVPTLSTGADNTDVFAFTTRDGGTTWAGFHGGYGFTSL